MSLYEHLVAMPEEKRLNTLETMPSYLAEIGQAERLQTILTTYDFLKAKVDAIGVEQLIADYELTTDVEAQLIQSALKACAHILHRDKGQFLVQLSGRIQEQAVRSRLFTSGCLQSGSLFLNFPTLAVIEEALVRTFIGHTDVVTKIRAGIHETFWSASWDGMVIEWDINRNEPLTIFNHPHKVDSFTVSPDERYVISGDDEGYLYVWDCNTKELINREKAHNGRIEDIKFENGPRLLNEPYTLISGSSDGTAIVWLFNQESLGKFRQLEGHTNGVKVVLLDRKKSMAVTGSWDNSIFVFQFKLDRTFRLTGHLSGVQDVYYDSDHNWLISASYDRTVRIWGLDFGDEFARLEHKKDEKLTSVVKIPSRDLIVAGGMYGHLYFWETEHFKFLGELATGNISITSLSIMNSKYLLTTSEDQIIRAYDVMRIQPGKSFSHKHGVSGVCITSMDKAISVSPTSVLESELYYWDMTTRTILMSIPDVPRHIMQLKKFIDDSGNSQIVLCSEEGVYLWQEGTSNISKLEHVGSKWITDVEFMPQRKILLICHDKALILIDTHKYEVVMEIPSERNARGKVAISPDETYIAHLAGGQINIYDAHTGEKVWTGLHEVPDEVASWDEIALDIEFSQDNCFVTVSENELRLWNLVQETPLVTRPILCPETEYKENIGLKGQIAISNNREFFVLTLYDLYLRIFNSATLELITTFIHRIRITHCAIAPDLEHENKYDIVIGDDEGEDHFLQFYL